MKQNKHTLMFSLVGIAVFSFVAIQVLADISDIQYPVPQLGNCQSETECRSYCDKPDNIEACLIFAEQNHLMPKEEIEMAKKFATTGNKGPGGCTGKDSCETYCNDISHIDECISFAEQNNLMPPDELHEAQKVRDAIKRGVKPPACGSKNSCDSYCQDQSHMEECITFASEAGLMDGKEKEDAQKMLQAIKRGVKPPPCQGKQACEEYCQQPDNMEACMNFAIEAGFMNDQEKENSQKMLSAIKKGVRPPNCRGKEECDNYCQSDEHMEECTNFAEAAGFMDPKEAEMARKTKGKGPGGCKGKEECESFCNKEDNREMCFKFAEDNNMIPKEELEKMKEGMNRMREQEGQKRQEEMSPSEEGRKFRGGPGGCSTPEECQNFKGSENEQRPMGSPNQNQFPPPREQREGEKRPEFQRPPQEFNQQPNRSGMPIQPREGENFPPRPEFQEQQFQGEQSRQEFERELPPSDGQLQQFEPMPQIQQQPQEEIAPPPPPPSEPAPQSLLNNRYLGAILRFLLDN